MSANSRYGNLASQSRTGTDLPPPMLEIAEHSTSTNTNATANENKIIQRFNNDGSSNIKQNSKKKKKNKINSYSAYPSNTNTPQNRGGGHKTRGSVDLNNPEKFGYDDIYILLTENISKKYNKNKKKNLKFYSLRVCFCLGFCFFFSKKGEKERHGERGAQ